MSGSEDSNIHVWSIARLLAFSATTTHEPLRSLSNHRAAITNLALGHSSTNTNICVSASKDSTVIVWNYHTGELLRTFLLPSIPLCLALDPCDRVAYVGFEDGSVQVIQFTQLNSVAHPLYDTRLQNTPVQVALPSWVAPNEAGSTLCIGLSYDGTLLLSGHSSGKLSQWDIGRRCFSAELADLNAPVTNIAMLSPFPEKRSTTAVTVVKPKLGEGNYTFTARLAGSPTKSHFDEAVDFPGFPARMLEDAIANFSRTAAQSSSGDEKLLKENEDLWKIINEQRAVQKKTWDKYSQLKTGDA